MLSIAIPLKGGCVLSTGKQTMKNIKTQQTIGIVWMVFHCFLISVMSAVITSSAHSINVFQIVFLYNGFAFLFLMPFVYKSGGIKAVITKKLSMHIIRAFLGAIALSMYFYSMTLIPLTEARAIALTAPLASSLMAVVFLKETMGWHRTTAMILGFFGALLIVRPGMESFSYVSLMVLVCVFMWAVIDLILKKLAKTESNICQLFYLTAFMTLFTLPPALYYWQMPENMGQWAVMMLLGIIFLLNMLAVINAFRNTDITVIMPFDFSGMVFTILIAYIFFDELIDTYTAIGSVIIMSASVYITRREAKILKTTHATVQQLEV